MSFPSSGFTLWNPAVKHANVMLAYLQASRPALERAETYTSTTMKGDDIYIGVKFTMCK